MNKHILQFLLEDYGLTVRSYSGRGMSGRECLAVEAGDRDLLRIIFDIGYDLGHEAGEVEAHPNRSDCGPDSLDDLSKKHQDLKVALRSVQQDTLGLGVVTYFPKVEFFSAASGEEPENDDDCPDCDFPMSECQCPES